MEIHQLTRPALGKLACLGDVYNAHTDSFCNVSVLSKNLPAHLINKIDNKSSDFQFLLNEDIREKFQKLNINGSISLSVLSGLVPLELSGKYLSEEKEGSKKVKSTLFYSITTVTEKMNDSNEEIAEYIATKALEIESLKASGATHVITEINWGAKVLVSAESNSTESTNSKEIKAGLKATLDKIVSVTAYGQIQGGLDSDGGSSGSTNMFSLRIHGDLIPNDMPQSFDQVQKFLKNVPTLIQSANDGKGTPISYVLKPINLLQAQLGLPQSSIIFRDLNENSVTRCLKVFHEMIETRRKLFEFMAYTRNYEEYLTLDNLMEVEKIQNIFEKEESSLKGQLRKSLIQYRKGEMSSSSGDKDEEEEGGSFLKCVSQVDFLDMAKKFLNYGHPIALLVKERIERAQHLETRGIRFLKRGESLDGTALQQSSAYVLFYSENAIKQDGSLWSETRQYFYKLVDENKEKNGTNAFFCMDTEILSTCPEDEAIITIRHYENGVCHKTNVYADHRNVLDTLITGVFKLVDNGNYGDYLTAIGVGGLQWYSTMGASITVTISEKEGKYTIEISSSFGRLGCSTQDFWLGEEFGETTMDGYTSMSTVTRHMNELHQIQKVTGQPQRQIIRKFTKNEMKVISSANGVTATRTFERVR